MRQTENYQLGLWELSDQVVHESFNENTEKIDAALAGLAESVEATAATIAASMPRVAVGTYKGAGNCGSSYPNKLTFGFKPKFLMVWGYEQYLMLAVEGQKLLINCGGSNSTTIEQTSTIWGDNYVSWYYTHPNGDIYGFAQMNRADTTYSYIAIG